MFRPMLDAPSTAENTDPRPPVRDWGGALTLLIWFWIHATAALASLASLVLFMLGAGWLWDRDRRWFHRFSTWWGVTLCRTTPITYEVRGAENLAAGPVVIVPNHQSVLDIPIMYLIDKPFRAVAKRDWFFYPIGLNIRLAGYLPTRRSANPERAAHLIAGCKRWLSRGDSILIFPEGGRSRTWSPVRFRRGPFELAATTGAPLQPIAIAGTNDILHPSSLRFGAGKHVIVEVLPAIPSECNDSRALRNLARARIEERVGALRAELKTRFAQGPAEAVTDTTAETHPARLHDRAV